MNILRDLISETEILQSEIIRNLLKNEWSRSYPSYQAKKVNCLKEGNTKKPEIKNFEESIIYCDKVLEIKSTDVYALKNKVFALESLKKDDEVLKL